MGKATRWFRGLLGLRRDKENADISGSGDRRERKRWSFGRSGKEVPAAGVGQMGGAPVSDSAWLRSYISETEKEQSKHAIAVAAATAAAADAAVAAAQAAVAVVRLTSQGRGTLFAGGRERWAAVKIQTVFRAHLARKALRALKGLVKLQALVRGYLVRKRATATLHSMQALIRAQSSVRAQRARRSFNRDHRIQPEFWHRRSSERFEDGRSEFHSKKHSTSHDSSSHSFDEGTKIVEIDTYYKPSSRSGRIHTWPSDSGEEAGYCHVSSPLPGPAGLSIPEHRSFHDLDWAFYADEPKFPSTAQSTPRFLNPGGRAGNVPPTPSKSVCGDSFFRPYSNFPSYMAHTQSFNAKLRSQSAPKQRPELVQKKRLSLNDIMASRASFSGVRMQRSSSHFQEAMNF